MRYDIFKYNRIKEMRDEYNLTQKQVADQLKVAQNTLSQYETGKINISYKILVKMANIYNTSTDYLVGLTDEKSAYPRRDSHEVLE